MSIITRRTLGAAALATLAAPRLARAQASGLGFMSFTYAEDAGRPHVQAVLDGFRAESGIAL